MVAGQDTAALDGHALRRLRGGQAAMIFQEPLLSLNPLKRVGEQIEETILTHQRPAPSAGDIKARVLELLTQVGLPNPPQLANSYPFELSGGQRQRVMSRMTMQPRVDLPETRSATSWPHRALD
jgi:peptide/nickel transport system ATP-binding protein